ncbi:hypothetical protein [Gillisia limnaea]|uniref:O-antigen polymerase n=1 Tax=Gillisia limnaea (strain DSM 15749 / LMG 21470 / R-8282) TaxID=865937 RepID=H2BT61_GILLR|nr:hypothetical protein [Gillisia limnaea]EHQ02619.1 hypothetical protein Gilli_1981 [Gillisia limnaea DSM 15749]
MGIQYNSISSNEVIQEAVKPINITILKNGVWIYFFLLIFEGALRKWVLPGLSEPLLLIRDPLALWLMFKAFNANVWKPNLFVKAMWWVSILSLSLALLTGHGNLTVGIFGFRITAVQFPLIFVIGAIFNKKDVIKVGEVMLWLNIGMTILVAAQFFSPQYAFINRGIGGDIEGSGFSGAAGFFRVPGTFSFTNGLAFFYGLTAAYLFYFWIAPKTIKGFKILLVFSTLALLIAIPLSISRTVLFEIAVSMVFMIAIFRKKPKIIGRVAITISAGLILFLGIKSFSFFETATHAFSERFTSANKTEGGLDGVFIDRFLGGMYGALTQERLPFWGMGMGMGTNVGAKILVGDFKKFLVAEEEWGRIVGELGVLLGVILILIRVSLVIHFLRKAWSSISTGNLLPWMMLSFGMFMILQGQWAQPTTLGFSVFAGGLIIASHREKNER